MLMWRALLTAGILVAGCTDESLSRDRDGRIDGAGRVPVTELRVGDCIEGIPRAGATGGVGVTEVDALPCDDAHGYEVFALLTHPGSDEFPGDAAIEDFAKDRCLERFTGYTGEEYGESNLEIALIGPVEASWEDGDREVACLLAQG